MKRKGVMKFQLFKFVLAGLAAASVMGMIVSINAGLVGGYADSQDLNQSKLEGISQGKGQLQDQVDAARTSAQNTEARENYFTNPTLVEIGKTFWDTVPFWKNYVTGMAEIFPFTGEFVTFIIVSIITIITYAAAKRWF